LVTDDVLLVDELNEAILDIEETGSTTRLGKVQEDSDEDVEAGVCFNVKWRNRMIINILLMPLYFRHFMDTQTTL
jgi:hypothetical protein